MVSFCPVDELTISSVLRFTKPLKYSVWVRKYAPVRIRTRIPIRTPNMMGIL